MADGQRSDLFSVAVTATDPATGESRQIGLWDGLSGGELDSEETVYNASGGVRVSLGGKTTPGNVVLKRLYDLTRDNPNEAFMLALVGRGDISVSKQPTNSAYAASGRPMSYLGTLKRYTPPEVDSDSSDPAMVEIEVTVKGNPKVS
jgi:hypothetical protein